MIGRMELVHPSLHLDDQVTLAEFVELWWADDLPTAGYLDLGDEYVQFLLNKQSAVRMLRQKHQGFPTPVGTLGRSQLFRLGDLVGWEPLRSIAEDRAKREGLPVLTPEVRAAQASPLWHLRRSIRSCGRWLVNQDADAQLRRLTVALALVLHFLREATTIEGSLLYAELLAPGVDTFELLNTAAGLLAAAVPDLGPAITFLADVPGRATLESQRDDLDRLVAAIDAALESGYDPARLVEVLLADLAPARAGKGGSRVTASALSRLVLAVADPQPDELVLDPTAGEGNLLLGVAEVTGGKAVLIGVEQDPAAWAVAVARFAVRGLSVDLTLGTFPDDQAGPVRADLVLVDPPLDSRKQYLHWLDLAEGSMDDDGRAVVVLSAVTLDTSRREWQLIGREGTSVVVETPSRLRSDYGDALAIWLVERPPTTDLLLLDASHLGQRRDGLSYVPLDESELVAETVRAWRSESKVMVRAPLTAEVVTRSDLGSTTSERVRADAETPGSTLGNFGDLEQLLGQRLAKVALPNPSNRRPALSRDLRARSGLLASDIQFGMAVTEARGLAERLSELVQGPLEAFTSEEQRRALRRLTRRLALEAGAESADDLAPEPVATPSLDWDLAELEFDLHPYGAEYKLELSRLRREPAGTVGLWPFEDARRVHFFLIQHRPDRRLDVQPMSSLNELLRARGRRGRPVDGVGLALVHGQHSGLGIHKASFISGLDDAEARQIAADCGLEVVYSWSPEQWSVISCVDDRRVDSGWSLTKNDQ